MYKLIDQGVATQTFPFEGLWLDVGRPDDYDRMVLEFQRDPTAYLPEGA
jgi:hypothetical protein